MKIYVKNTNGLVLPTQGSEYAAGYDVVAITEPKITGQLRDNEDNLWEEVSYIEYGTGLYITPSVVTSHTLIYPRSSISKTNLVLANSIGLVDVDYTGQIICRFKYIWQPKDLVIVNTPFSDGVHNQVRSEFFGKVNFDKIYKLGDKIAQLVFSQTLNVEFEVVDELPKSKRGDGGFGSTDQKTSEPKPEKKSERKSNKVDKTDKVEENLPNKEPVTENK